MASLNKVLLVGHLGRDPDVRVTAQGAPICNLSLATSERFKDKTGESREVTEWHRVVLYRRLAEVARDHLKKGDLVYLEGSLKTRKWQDKSGQDRYTTEIVLRPYNGTLTLLDGRRDGDGGGSGGDYGGSDGGGSGAGGGSGYGAGGRPGGDIDDEIPFFMEWRI